MKTLKIIILTVLIIVCIFPIRSLAESNSITIKTLVPIRDIFEKSGYTVRWDGENNM